MKKWILLAAAMTAAGIFVRLPHPARDIARLEPVQTLYFYMEGDVLHMEADTGAAGSGASLEEAAADMKAKAAAEIFLETAEYVILSPEVTVTEAFFEILHPSSHVCRAEVKPDLTAAAEYLDIHTPETTLADLRAAARNPE